MVHLFTVFTMGIFCCRSIFAERTIQIVNNCNCVYAYNGGICSATADYDRLSFMDQIEKLLCHRKDTLYGIIWMVVCLYQSSVSRRFFHHQYEDRKRYQRVIKLITFATIIPSSLTWLLYNFPLGKILLTTLVQKRGAPK
jgi:hypothetical protein